MNLRNRSTTNGNYLLIGEYTKPSASPRIGDVRISRQYVPKTTISLIGEQQESSIVPHQTKAGKAIFLLEE
jgi:hypothetical protein